LDVNRVNIPLLSRGLQLLFKKVITATVSVQSRNQSIPFEGTLVASQSPAVVSNFSWLV